MTSPSALPEFIDKLVAVFDAAVAVEVYDGPPVTDANKQAYVAVGWDGVDVDGGDAADVDQGLAYLGSLTKDETATVNCVAVSWSGSTSWKAERDLAFGYLSACDQALRAAIRTDAVLMAYQVYQVSAGSLVYDKDPQSGNPIARVPFTVTYSKQI